MKGIVFTEFLEMIEEQHGPEMADRIILQAELASGGAYTAVGTYDHREAIRLVRGLSDATGMAPPEVLRAFGKHLFTRFVKGYPQFFEGNQDAFSFLEKIDSYVHVEVKKLYPDAQLPKFDC